jgi:hypothetical protein
VPTFVFTYRMPMDYVPGNSDVMAKWSAWFDSLGSSLADTGNPVFESTEVGRCSEGTQLGGYSFVTAEDLESAAAIAKECPALESGGGVEVGAVTVLHSDSPSSGRD